MLRQGLGLGTSCCRGFPSFTIFPAPPKLSAFLPFSAGVITCDVTRADIYPCSVLQDDSVDKTEDLYIRSVSVLASMWLRGAENEQIRVCPSRRTHWHRLSRPLTFPSPLSFARLAIFWIWNITNKSLAAHLRRPPVAYLLAQLFRRRPAHRLRLWRQDGGHADR
jgi:hypothetical protein